MEIRPGAKNAANLAAFAFLLQALFLLNCCAPVAALGLITTPVHMHPVVRNHVVVRANHVNKFHSSNKSSFSKYHHHTHLGSLRLRRHQARVPVQFPQNFIGSLKSTVIAPGVVYKSYRGLLNINLVDIDMVHSSAQVRPILATEVSKRLADVRNQAQSTNAIAAVNANYFKRDGTPLGTLIMNGEWIAGPLYDRVSMGITKDGFVRMDRVNLYGDLQTSNPNVGSIWVNNINQPRRTGSRLIAYTRRWGPEVNMAYAGCLVAVNASGQVVEKTTTVMTIPPGGFVLSDKKESQINQLMPGDTVSLSWNTRPSSWQDVVSAVSGGPMLIHHGDLFIDLKSEQFVRGWAGSGIKARTAAGVTSNNHLLLATIEGPHTLWDLAKFLHKLGAEEAMNLDGGGSTTMVIKGRIVTRNANSFQRHVASSLAVIQRSSEPIAINKATDFTPTVPVQKTETAAPVDDKQTNDKTKEQAEIIPSQEVSGHARVQDNSNSEPLKQSLETPTSVGNAG